VGRGTISDSLSYDAVVAVNVIDVFDHYSHNSQWPSPLISNIHCNAVVLRSNLYGGRIQPARAKYRVRRADLNPSTAHMFIVNPLKGKKISTLFSTHPSTEERISRLRSMQ
jgi:hypothetical protein